MLSALTRAAVSPRGLCTSTEGRLLGGHGSSDLAENSLGMEDYNLCIVSVKATRICSTTCHSTPPPFLRRILPFRVLLQEEAVLCFRSVAPIFSYLIPGDYDFRLLPASTDKTLRKSTRGHGKNDVDYL